jgi:small subunit ribosomal protein S9
MTEEEKSGANPEPEEAGTAEQRGERPEQDAVPEGGIGEAEQTPTEAPAGEGEGEVAGEALEDPAKSAAEEPTGAEEPGAESGDRAAHPEPEVAPAAEPRPREKKGDVIPGAHLEPIVVEPETAPISAEERARIEAEEEERARREAELVGETEEPDTASRAPAQMESGARYLATGKRKNAIARVTLSPGEGKFEVNKRALDEFFPRPLHQTMARQALVASGYEGTVDVRVLVHGGGVSGQAGAVRHGIARALTEIDPELRGDLKRRGFLTRDARVKERRKAGLKKARKRPQFSKR